MQQDIYLLTKRCADGSYLNPLEMPFYFSFQQAKYFFNFAETRIPCKPGEEIVLLKHQANVHFPEHSYQLEQLVSNPEDLTQWQVVAYRVAKEPRMKKIINFPNTCEAAC